MGRHWEQGHAGQWEEVHRGKDVGPTAQARGLPQGSMAFRDPEIRRRA